MIPEVRFVKTSEKSKLPAFNIQDKLTGDIGADIYSIHDVCIPARNSAIIQTGLCVGYITPGYYFIISPRSGLGFKHSLQPCLGRIDNRYRGNLDVKMFNFSDVDYQVSSGDRIAQLEFHQLIQPNLVWCESVEDTQRGAKGFGSSGK